MRKKRMTIGAARRAIAELLADVWRKVGKLNNIDSHTSGYIEALNKVLEVIGGTPPKIKKCLDPECENIVVQIGPGRNRKYCSGRCRARAYRSRNKSDE